MEVVFKKRPNNKLHQKLNFLSPILGGAEWH